MSKRRIVNVPTAEEIARRVYARMGRILDRLEAADTDNPDPPPRARWPRRRG